MTIETSVVTDEEFEQLRRLPDYVSKGPGCIAREQNGVFYVVIAQSVDAEESSLDEAVKAEWETQQKGIRSSIADGAVEELADPVIDGAPGAEEAVVTNPDNPHELVMHNGNLIPKSDRDAYLRSHPDVIPLRHDPLSSRPRDVASHRIDFSRWPF
jgi:hypothetical protein